MLSKLDLAMNRITADDLLKVMQVGKKYSDSTLRKHDWVETLYQRFCEAQQKLTKQGLHSSVSFTFATSL
jgi:hypothetical protein